MSKIRTVKESPRYQGVDEEITYRFDWTDIGAPSAPAVVIKNHYGTDVTALCITGAPAVAATYYVVTGVVAALVDGEEYRLECKATVGGNILERMCIIVGEA
jgi:hypothetical protein